jgi:hypothetical protein
VIHQRQSDKSDNVNVAVWVKNAARGVGIRARLI